MTCRVQDSFLFQREGRADFSFDRDLPQADRFIASGAV